MVKIKPLYMSCEIQRRELHARLFFAVLAAQRGYTSLLSHKVILRQNLPNLPPGIFWHKSATKSCTHYFVLAKQHGHRTVATYEEMLYYDDKPVTGEASEELLRLFFDPKAASLIDAYLSSTVLDSLTASQLPFGKVFDVGNSRVEILRGRNRAIFTPYVNYIKETIGPFVLVNSSIGLIYSYRQLEHERQEFKSAVGEKQNLTTTFFDELHERDARGKDAAEAMCRNLSAEGRKIVVRPHPHENPELWRQRLDGIPNVTLEDRDSVIPWLMAADGVLQGNCTTGLEALLLERPVGNYMDNLDATLTARLIPPRGWQEALEQIKQPPTGEAVDALRKSLHGVDENITEHTLDAFDTLDPPECEFSDLLGSNFRSLSHFGNASMDRRWPPLDYKYCKAFVKVVASVLGISDIGMINPVTNAIIIGPASAMATAARPA